MLTKITSLDGTFEYFGDFNLAIGSIPKIIHDTDADEFTFYPSEHYFSLMELDTNVDIKSDDYVKSAALKLRAALEDILRLHLNSRLYVTLRGALDACDVYKNEARIMAMWVQSIMRVDTTGEVHFYYSEPDYVGWKYHDKIKREGN